MSSSLYPDLEDGLISKEQFNKYRMIYRTKIKELKYKIKLTEETEIEILENVKKAGTWIIDIQRYKNLDVLDRMSMVFLINKISVAENKEVIVEFNHFAKLETISTLLETINQQKTECREVI